MMSVLLDFVLDGSEFVNFTLIFEILLLKLRRVISMKNIGIFRNVRKGKRVFAKPLFQKIVFFIYSA
jgi:hypothetical protein